MAHFGSLPRYGIENVKYSDLLERKGLAVQPIRPLIGGWGFKLLL